MHFCRKSDDWPTEVKGDAASSFSSRAALPHRPFEMTQLARARRWDQRPFLDELDRQAFAAILIYRVPGLGLERQRWTDEMLRVIDRR